MSDSIRIIEMPDLGTVTDASSLVGERAGSGRFAATALRDYCAADISAAMAPVVAAPTIAAAVTQLGAIGTVTTTSPVLQFNINEALSMGTGFFEPIVINLSRTGGSGHRQAFTSQVYSSGAAATENLVGGGLFAFLLSGSGSIFGGNAFARTYAAADATAACIGFETNTDAQGTVKRKVGLQIVDVSTSVGNGTDYSAAIYIVRQPGGVGYRDGILFGDDFTANMGGSINALMRTASTAGSATVARGLDFRTATFTNEAIALPNAASITWIDGNGGRIVSDTPANGPSIHFGNNGFSVVGASGAAAMSIGTSATPTVSIFVTGVGMRQIAAGAADSGGAGARMLIVPN